MTGLIRRFGRVILKEYLKRTSTRSPYTGVCLTAIDGNGGIATHAFTVTVDNASSAGDEWLSAMVVYPNPVEDVLHLRHAITDFDLTIYNVHGTVRRSFKSQSNSLSADLSDLPAGVYFVKIQNPMGTAFMVEKIIRK